MLYFAKDKWFSYKKNSSIIIIIIVMTGKLYREIKMRKIHERNEYTFAINLSQTLQTENTVLL